MIFVNVYDADTNQLLGCFDVEFNEDWDIVEEFEEAMIKEGHHICSINIFQRED